MVGVRKGFETLVNRGLIWMWIFACRKSSFSIAWSMMRKIKLYWRTLRQKTTSIFSFWYHHVDRISGSSNSLLTRSWKAHTEAILELVNTLFTEIVDWLWTPRVGPDCLWESLDWSMVFWRRLGLPLYRRVHDVPGKPIWIVLAFPSCPCEIFDWSKDCDSELSWG